ncbi:MAG: GntR family transcriptional regulator [Paenibacillus sp.]|jgi:DNA-binding FadR family transcriptional regulator|nr:GntR family transcriptional regulator [Paenibacillus sp.]
MNSKISFQNVNRRQLVDEVVMQLQKKISSGDIPPGHKIPTEPELMEQFGVGRSTVREAVRVLVHAGLLEKKQGFGTYLNTNLIIQEPLDHRLRRAEILEVFEVRRMLELEIAKLAAERRDDNDLAQMRGHLDKRAQAIQAAQVNDYLNADICFHIAVAAASKNAVVIDLYRTFSTVLREALSKLVSGSLVHDPHELFHENLYEAIKKKDPSAAIHWTVQNLDQTVAELEESLANADGKLQ